MLRGASQVGKSHPKFFCDAALEHKSLIPEFDEYNGDRFRLLLGSPNVGK